MYMTRKIMSSTAIGALMLGAVFAITSVKAEAATIPMENGGSTLNIGPGPTLNFGSAGADTGAGGAGFWEYTFGLTVEGTGFGTSAISVNNFNAFVNPTIAWLDQNSSVISFVPVMAVPIGSTSLGFAELTTSFTDPNYLIQSFRLSWDEGTQADAGFDISVNVSPVPLPAGGLLLLTALGGVAALRRRRKAA